MAIRQIWTYLRKKFLDNGGSVIGWFQPACGATAPTAELSLLWTGCPVNRCQLFPGIRSSWGGAHPLERQAERSHPLRTVVKVARRLLQLL